MLYFYADEYAANQSLNEISSYVIGENLDKINPLLDNENKVSIQRLLNIVDEDGFVSLDIAIAALPYTKMSKEQSAQLSFDIIHAFKKFMNPVFYAFIDKLTVADMHSKNLNLIDEYYDMLPDEDVEHEDTYRYWVKKMIVCALNSGTSEFSYLSSPVEALGLIFPATDSSDVRSHKDEMLSIITGLIKSL